MKKKLLPFSHTFCKSLTKSSLPVLLPIPDRLLFLHGTHTHIQIRTSGDSCCPLHHTGIHSLALKDPHAPIPPHLPRQNSSSGQPADAFAEHTSLMAPFLFYSHTCYWLVCFSLQITQPLYPLPFRCISLAPSPSISTSSTTTTASGPDGHLPSPLPAPYTVR